MRCIVQPRGPIDGIDELVLGFRPAPLVVVGVRDQQARVALEHAGHIGVAGAPGDLVGAPHVINPRDSYNDYEPLETVVIGSAAANGVYKVFLDSPWAGYGQWSSTWTGSGASVQIYSGATAIGTFYSAPPAACGANEFWYVGDLTKNGSAYTWTGKNTCSNTKP